MTNSADVAAAAALGIDRVVLAREMTLAEIRKASEVRRRANRGVRSGALCFSVSGRCYLSSWAGGRSGNRGSCTSPCRVPWAEEVGRSDTPFSMRDLAAADRVDEVREAGVAALKIEGRMKNAAWVRQAVATYRRALRGEGGPQLAEELVQLGTYTGRSLTSGYLDGQRDSLTGTAGREARPAKQRDAGAEEHRHDDDSGDDLAEFQLAIDVEPDGIQCRCTSGERTEQWRLPKTVVRRQHKAVPIGGLLTWLSQHPPAACRPGELTTNDPDYLLVPRVANRLAEQIAGVVRRAGKETVELTGIDLPDAVRSVLEKPEAFTANRVALGGKPDRVRVDAAAVGPFARRLGPGGVIVEGLTTGTLAKVRRAVGKTPLVVALPSVFFEKQIPQLKELLAVCKQAGLLVEVNSWGGWQLARAAGVRLEGGPGLPVLNSLAARQLAQLGMRNVTLSAEADRRKLEELTAHCPVACSLVVFGRPPLLTSRVQLSEEEFGGKTLVDRRDVKICGRRERDLWVFRPVEPFDLRDLRNDKIRVAHLVVDLVGSDNPEADYAASLNRGGKPFRFNYDRVLA